MGSQNGPAGGGQGGESRRIFFWGSKLVIPRLMEQGKGGGWSDPTSPILGKGGVAGGTPSPPGAHKTLIVLVPAPLSVHGRPGLPSWRRRRVSPWMRSFSPTMAPASEVVNRSSCGAVASGHGGFRVPVGVKVRVRVTEGMPIYREGKMTLQHKVNLASTKGEAYFHGGYYILWGDKYLCPAVHLPLGWT